MKSSLIVSIRQGDTSKPLVYFSFLVRAPADPALSGQTQPARIDSYADHRIAMCFALAGLRIHGITIEDPDCVSKTFPNYWAVLESLGVEIAFT